MHEKHIHWDIHMPGETYQIDKETGILGSAFIIEL
jgi:hypothetical protein